MGDMSIFYGGHRCAPGWKAAERNQEIVREKCCAVTVTADDLAEAVDENGVSNWRAEKLVEKLIKRAQQEAIARTLGIVG